MTRLVCIHIAVLLLAACGVPSKDDGSVNFTGAGSIRLTSSALKSYEYYFRHRQGLDFVITEDGTRGFYSYCTSASSFQCADPDAIELLKHCEERTSSPCKVFARDKKIVWQNPGNWRTEIQPSVLHYYHDWRGFPVRPE